MAKTVTGGCLCGAVRYAYDGEVGAAGYCHCADCRKVSGSAFGVSVRVTAAGFSIVAGQPKGYTKAGDSGRPAVISDMPDAYAETFREVARQLAARVSRMEYAHEA